MLREVMEDVGPLFAHLWMVASSCGSTANVGRTAFQWEVVVVISAKSFKVFCLGFT